MKVGDLVRVLDDPEVRRINCDIPDGSIGIITETPHADEPENFKLASVWVQWNGAPSWDIMFLNDLEIVSEAR